MTDRTEQRRTWRTGALSRRTVLKGVGGALAVGALPAGIAGVAAAPAPGPAAYPVPGTPYDTAGGFNVGPDAWNAVYGMNRQFFPVQDTTRWGVVWQAQDADGPAKGQLYATWFGADPNAATNTVPLQQTEEMLVAAASDDAGTLYTFTVQRGDGTPSSSRQATLTRRAPDGTTNAVNPDTSAAGLDIATLDSNNTGAMRVANGQVALMFSRTLTQSDDGLNHQSGWAVVFDATSLALTKSHGQTSGHSWASVLTKNAAGQFVATEVGDNFPRGVQLHRFDAQGIASRVVYTYKTKHGTDPNSPSGAAYPVYAAASGGGTTYYQWSNDNQVYTELGGVAETAGGYLVVLAGERPSLDNSKVGGNLNVARDLAALVVRKDFENASRGKSRTSVTDDLVVSQGAPPEESGYYTFTGDLTPQRTKGVVWLTTYPGDKSRNASRVKVAPLPDGSAMIIWEVWTPTAYVETNAMTVRVDGTNVTTVKPPTSLGSTLRLNPRDDVVVRGGKVYVVSGSGANKQLLVTALDPSTY